MKNNMSFRYFRHHFKSTWLRMAILIFICVIIAGATAQDVYADYDRWLNYKENYPQYEMSLRLTLNLGVFAAMAIILNLILPFIELSRFNSRKYLDSAFTYPISRISLITVHLITGFIHFLAAFTASYLWYAIALLPFAEYFDYTYIIGFFFISILWSAFYFIFNSFFFSLCNSTADGVLTTLTWQYVLCPAIAVIGDLLSINRLPDFSLYCITFTPYTDICQHFVNKATYKASGYDLLSTLYRIIGDIYFPSTAYLITYLSVITILGIGLYILMIFMFKKKRAESASEPTNSIVSYKLLIPAIVFMLLYLGFDTSLTLFGMLALVFATIAYVIYRRSVRLKVFDLIVIGICAVLMLAGFMQ